LLWKAGEIPSSNQKDSHEPQQQKDAVAQESAASNAESRAWQRETILTLCIERGIFCNCQLPAKSTYSSGIPG